MELFLKRLGISVLAVVGTVTYFVIMGFIIDWLSNIHLSTTFKLILEWVFLIAIVCLLIWGVVLLLRGLWGAFKWLFVEPFRRDKSK